MAFDDARHHRAAPADHGRPRSAATARTVTAASADAMRDAARRCSQRFDPDTIVLMSPHAPRRARRVRSSTRAERSRGDLARVRRAAGRASTPPATPSSRAAILASAADARACPRSTAAPTAALDPGELDHGVLVPLCFLDRAGRCPLVVLSLSFLPLRRRTARSGAPSRDAAATLGRRVAFVASGDCSHRLTPDAPAGYSPRRARVRRRARATASARATSRACRRIDRTSSRTAGECGLRSFDHPRRVPRGDRRRDARARVRGPVGRRLPHRASPATRESPRAAARRHRRHARGGPQGRHARRRRERAGRARAPHDRGVRARRRRRRTRTARRRRLLASRRRVRVAAPRRRAARLHRHDRAHAADARRGDRRTTPIQAATRDPRFPPLTAEELDDLDISVDVLHEPGAVASLDELDPKPTASSSQRLAPRPAAARPRGRRHAPSSRSRSRCRRRASGRASPSRSSGSSVDRYH